MEIFGGFLGLMSFNGFVTLIVIFSITIVTGCKNAEQHEIEKYQNLKAESF